MRGVCFCVIAAVTWAAALGAESAGEQKSASTQGTRRWRVKRTAMMDALEAEDHKHNSSCPVDHTGLLSPSTACCYQKLVKDPNCCVDKGYKPGVRFRDIHRPDTSWICNGTTGCYDSPEGPRGRDLMAIPSGANCSTPRILYVHGGSWMYGSPRTAGYSQLASRLALATGAVIFMNDYPLVPYGNFSTILKHSIRALNWLARHGPDDACPSSEQVPLFVAGDSSGGGTALSLVLQLQAMPELLPKRHLSGAFLFSPWTNLMCNTPEYYTNAFAKIQSPKTFKDLTPLEEFVGDIIFQALTTTNSDDFSANALDYVGEHASTLQTDPIASPYFAKPEHFSGSNMPPLHIVVGGSESIMGDSVRVARSAAKGGADVTVEIYNGMWHVFPMYSEGCGSDTELWAATHAINSTGSFVRAVVAGIGKKTRSWGQAWKYFEGKAIEKHPFIEYLYDPMVDRFSEVGELMPHTASWDYADIMKEVSKQPWWVVLPSLGGSAVVIFISGMLAGGLMDFGGREAYKRAKRVQEYRRKCVEVPVGYVNLDAMGPQREGKTPMTKQRSFLMDFVIGVPEEDVHSAWRVETVRAKQGLDEARDAARAENAAWRRMGVPGYQPPQEVPKAPEPVETLETGAAASDLRTEVSEAGVAESWAVATKEAKDGSIQAARRENMAWRMQHMRGSQQ